MAYRIDALGRPNQVVRSRKALIEQLKNAAPGTISDIRKLYKSGVSDSVMETYKKYIREGGTDGT